jgi:hypothetical protein
MKNVVLHNKLILPHSIMNHQHPILLNQKEKEGKKNERKERKRKIKLKK